VLDAVNVKAAIVARDEREGGVRRLLNLGHTLGHAIEKLTRTMNHGEAVAVGMSLVAHAAEHRGVLAVGVAERIDSLLVRLGFDIVPPVPVADILREVRHDKKRVDDTIHIVLPEHIGCCRVERVAIDELVNMF